jgi:cytochrome P450
MRSSLPWRRDRMSLRASRSSQASSALRTARGPRGSLLLGNIGQYLADPTAFMIHMPRVFGPVVRVRLFHIPFYMVTHPDAVQRILHDNVRNYQRNPRLTDPLKVSFGDGLIVSEGDLHRRQRRLMQPMFHHRQIVEFGDLMVRETSAMLAIWERVAGTDQPIDVAVAMKRLALTILSKALFGANIEESLPTILTTIKMFNNDAYMRAFLPFYPPPRVPTPYNRRYLAASRALEQVVTRLITERRASSTGATDLLSLLVQAQDAASGAPRSDQQIRDEVVTLLLAGHDTVANTLAWTFFLLAHHPEVAERLWAELARVLGGRPPAVADLAALPFNRMIIDEALRLYPPVPVDGRRALAADALCGYSIPANANVNVAIYAVHRHPDYWERPGAFDPERFSPTRAAGRHRYAYLPFFGGPHLCIGKEFALLEAQLVLATVAQRYRLALAPGQVVRPRLAVTMGPRDGLPMMVHVR